MFCKLTSKAKLIRPTLYNTNYCFVYIYIIFNKKDIFKEKVEKARGVRREKSGFKVGG